VAAQEMSCLGAEARGVSLARRGSKIFEQAIDARRCSAGTLTGRARLLQAGLH